MAREGTGAESLFGVKIEETSDVFNVGHLAVDVTVVSAPGGAPTTIVGAAGNLTGSIEYRFRYITKGGFRTTASAVSTPLAATADKVDLSVLANSASANVIGKQIERRIDGGAWGVVKILWNNTATTYTDDLLPALVDYSTRMPTYNETGANGGFKFWEAQAHKMGFDHAIIDPKKLTGSAVPARGLPGAVKYEQTTKDVLSAGIVVPIFGTLYGAPTKYGVESGAFVADGATVDEGTKKYVFTPASAGSYAPRSLSVIDYKGGTKRPILFPQHQATMVDLSVGEQNLVEMSTNWLGIAHSRAGWALAAASVGSYTGRPVLYGSRQDAAKDTSDLLSKCTVAPAAGVFSLQHKIGAGSYGDTVVGAYNTTSNKQTQRAGNPSDKIEVLANGLRVGADSGSNRKIVGIVYPGAVGSTLPLNAEFTFKAAGMEIPGAGTTPGTSDGTFSGFEPVDVTTPGFTAAHVTVRRGSVSADTFIEANQVKVKTSQPKKVKAPLGAEAMLGTDNRRDGVATLEFELERDLIDSVFEGLIEADTTFAIQVIYEGERIPVTPGDPATAGTLSTFRETVQFDCTTAQVTGVTSSVDNEGVVKEMVKIACVGTAFTVTVITREDWSF